MESKTRIESGYGEGVADRIDRVGMGWVFKGDEPGGPIPPPQRKKKKGVGEYVRGGSSSEASLLRKRGVCFRREGSSSKGGKGSSLERGGNLLWKGGGVLCKEEGSKPRARFCGMAVQRVGDSLVKQGRPRRN